ncbi:hypothetical protein HJC23_011964 [Cyclotella cryptica]|uniref:SGNH hydrolase-type esterase domain-containing protein n=1 Tax=Cyclotella cryptica TaxID=29204 RepID=A0ABD3QQY4_9STRA|eukprot:CCRYP_003015-RA/>CCRYP_003015-RA protein AED:0.00 eAED:0.00 QI:216/-1/1/1/-1/1/1/875/290
MRRERLALFTMIATTSFIFGTLSFRPTIQSHLKRSSSLKMMSSMTTSPKFIRILCYGDSLTAGTSPQTDQLHPYGPHLERELNRLYSLESDDAPSIVVRWRGLPGWTASAMSEYLDDSTVGLRSAANSIRDPSLSLVIILAGTNDIGMLTSSMNPSGDGVDAEMAIEPILSLHRACLESDSGDDRDGSVKIGVGSNELRTLAVGIPESAWQQSNQSAQKLCNDMNILLASMASSSTSNFGGRLSFVGFPFVYAREDSKWSSDGLHLSPEGYEVLGVELASSVKKILDDSS